MARAAALTLQVAGQAGGRARQQGQAVLTSRPAPTEFGVRIITHQRALS
jgi:hypothetical protein